MEGRRQGERAEAERVGKADARIQFGRNGRRKARWDIPENPEKPDRYADPGKRGIEGGGIKKHRNICIYQKNVVSLRRF